MSIPFENMARWFAYSIHFHERFLIHQNPVKNVNRGDVYACFLGQNIGFEKSRLEPRPCIVVSIDQINHASGNVVIIPLSKHIKWKQNQYGKLVPKYDWHYVLYKAKYPLKYDSVAQCEDIRSISKVRLGKYICHIDQIDMANLTKRIKRALQL